MRPKAEADVEGQFAPSKADRKSTGVHDNDQD